MKLKVGAHIRGRPGFALPDSCAIREGETYKITEVSINGFDFRCDCHVPHFWWYFSEDLFELVDLASLTATEVRSRMADSTSSPLLHLINLETLEEHLPFMVKELRKFRDGETLVSTAEYKQLCEVLEKFP